MSVEGRDDASPSNSPGREPPSSDTFFGSDVVSQPRLLCEVKVKRHSHTRPAGKSGDTVHCCTLLLQAWRRLQPAPRWNPREARARSGSHTLSSQPRSLAGLVQWSRPSQGPFVQPAQSGAESVTPVALNSNLLYVLRAPTQAASECPSGHGRPWA